MNEITRVTLCDVLGLLPNESGSINPLLADFIDRVARRVEQTHGNYPNTGPELKSSQVISLAVEFWSEIHPTERLATVQESPRERGV